MPPPSPPAAPIAWLAEGAAPVPYAGLRYNLSSTLFDPRKFSVTPATRQTPPRAYSRLDDSLPLGVPSYNLALARLPAGVQARLPGRPPFLGSLRHNKGQCANLGSANLVQRSGTAFLFFGADLQPVLNLTVRMAPSPSFWRFVSDLRLFVAGDQVMVQFLRTADGAAHWTLGELTLTPAAPTAGGGVSVTFALRLLGPCLALPARTVLPPPGRNFALVTHGDTLFIHPWPLRVQRSPPAWTVAGRPAAGLAVAAAPAAEADRLRAVGLPDAALLHGNGILLDLGAAAGALLGMAHAYLSHRQGGALFGAHYMQYFYLVDRTPPYALQAQSPPFCIPAGHDAARCDLIQFVMSAVLVDRPDAVALTYGINDCESAAVLVARAEVLRFTRHGGVLAFL